MYEKNNDINRRVFFVGGGMIILSSFLLSRLWKLQVSEQDKYLLLSDKNRIRITPLFPKRGIFYDRNGNELALNSSNFKLTYSSGSALPDQVLIKKMKLVLLCVAFKAVAKGKPLLMTVTCLLYTSPSPRD